MAKKTNNILLIAGVGVAAFIVYEMTKPKAIATTVTPTPVPASSGNSVGAGLTALLTGLYNVITGSSNNDSNNLPPLAVSTPVPDYIDNGDSGASDLNYINPNATFQTYV